MRYAVLLYQDEVVWGPATTVGAEALVGVANTSEAGDRPGGG